MTDAPATVWLEAVALQEEEEEVLQKLAVSAGLPVVGPEAVNCIEPLDLEVVVALELEEQLPELPLTPV
jgi:hypothetical protein